MLLTAAALLPSMPYLFEEDDGVRKRFHIRGDLPDVVQDDLRALIRVSLYNNAVELHADS